MSSNLRVNNILPSVGTNVAIGTAGGSITLTGTVGSVGINTTNPPDSLTILGRVQIQQNNISNGDNRLVFRGVPSSSYRWSIDNNSSSNTFRIFREDDATAANGAVAVSISTTRNLSIENGNLVFSTAGTGIDFSATANSSGTMTGELLSDYEEGTWTPASSFSGGNGNRTDVSTGSYTKIGDVVYAFFEIVITKGTASGNLQITGLPYSRGGSDKRAGAYFVYHNTTSLTNGLYGYISDSSTIINVFHSNNIAAITAAGNLGTSTQFIGTAIYKV